MKRVVITGLGAVTGLGPDMPSLIEGIEKGKSAVRYMEGWNLYKGLRCLVGAPVDLQNEKAIPRQSRRSMGRMSIFAVQAAQQALNDANIAQEMIISGRLGCIIGSTMGSAQSLNEAFEAILPEKDLTQLQSMKFFQCVSHSAALNVAHHLGIAGYVMATSAACLSSLQAVGTGYALIKLGEQDVIICGGTEELHPTVTGSFDVIFATSSHYNHTPSLTPRPFDRQRDGLVCGEGSGILILEEYEHALRRKAKIYAEIVGYNTCGNGPHVCQSNKDAIGSCLRRALESASLDPSDIDYINAHATATIQGDKEEVEAIREIFGHSVPVTSLKGYIGHTLGASGAVELIASLIMMDKGIIYPTLNLTNISPECEGIWHVMEPLSRNIDIFLKNSFAFGGINAALVCKRVHI